MSAIREDIAADGIVVYKFKCRPECFRAIPNQRPDVLQRVGAAGGETNWGAGGSEAHCAAPNAAATGSAGVFAVEHVCEALQRCHSAQLLQRSVRNVEHYKKQCPKRQCSEQ